jgi:hypothetical protein
MACDESCEGRLLKQLSSSMRHVSFILSLVCFLSLFGCATVERKVPVGTYREKGTTNFISVSDKEMRVHIAGADKRDTTGEGLAFKYALWSDGRLFLVVERSAELLYGYPSLDLHLEGDRIISEDRHSRSRWEFVKR